MFGKMVDKFKIDVSDKANFLIEETSFKSSGIPVPEPIAQYLTDILGQDSCNETCLDCRVKLSTHCLVAYGSFVCEDCANLHCKLFTRHYCGMKPVFKVHWDDYQLLSITVGFGGNGPLLSHLKEYELDE